MHGECIPHGLFLSMLDWEELGNRNYVMKPSYLLIKPNFASTEWGIPLTDFTGQEKSDTFNRSTEICQYG